MQQLKIKAQLLDAWAKGFTVDNIATGIEEFTWVKKNHLLFVISLDIFRLLEYMLFMK